MNFMTNKQLPSLYSIYFLTIFFFSPPYYLARKQYYITS